MTSNRRLEIGLLLIRVSTAAFFLVWSLEKILHPEITQRVFSTFYFMEISTTVAIALGVAQTAVILGFLVGFAKRWTYGALLVMHGISTVSTWERLIDPYTTPNHLFWAAVPALAALAMLYLMRDEDRLFTVSSRRPAMA